MTLRERREALGVSSQVEMAQRCGVAQGTISYAERGIVSPGTDTLIRLSKGYRMSLKRVVEAIAASRAPHREVA